MKTCIRVIGVIRGFLFPVPRHLLCWLALALCVAPQSSVNAQILQYSTPVLSSNYPSGARRGETVNVVLRGVGIQLGENRLVIDGPPGITVSDVQATTHSLQATFRVAADAAPGRRLVRVHHVQSGLTNFRYFDVGTLPESLESEPNDTPEKPQQVELPLVVNARIQKTLDVDWFRFRARAGQKLVAAVMAHEMDSLVDVGKGYLDTSLELRDEQGKILAADEDTLGLDPLIHVTIPRDGLYTLGVRSLSYQGSEHAVYRLTLGEVPYPTAVFPPGGQRGKSIELEVTGPNVLPGTKHTVGIESAGSSPTQSLFLHGPALGSRALNILRGEHAEIMEREPNDRREQAGELKLPITVNGRFGQAGDEDWYRVRLAANEGMLLQTAAQRGLRSPADTALAVFDAAGKKLAEDDDAAAFGGYVQCAHDFESSDSFLMFTAPVAGDYFVRAANMSAAAGPRAVYRLQAEPLRGDFLIHQWPDAVPIWGPGTSATFVAEVLRWGGLQGDVQVSVEGLPKGWQGSVAAWPRAWYPYINGNMAMKLLLTITAPADAPVGTLAPFRVVGRARVGDATTEHEAMYMTLYGNGHNDRMHVRHSPLTRAVVCQPLGVPLSTGVKELTVEAGQTAQIPVTLHRREGDQSTIGLVVNGPTPSAGCAWGAPLTVKPGERTATVVFSTQEKNQGTYALTVANGWASDLRAGRPGPCTPLILVYVREKGK
jgi:hypothetical protein